MNRPNLSCGLTQPQDVVRRVGFIKALYESAVERHELEDGFALRFRGDAATERQVFDFVAMERDCCPFLSFEVRLAAERGTISLLAKGPNGVKEFARGELGRLGLDAESFFAPKR